MSLFGGAIRGDNQPYLFIKFYLRRTSHGENEASLSLVNSNQLHLPLPSLEHRRNAQEVGLNASGAGFPGTETFEVGAAREIDAN